jgi:hypothetical protein
MEHRATSQFWHHYRALQPPIRGIADKQFSLLKGNPQHRSLQFKKSATGTARKFNPPE